MGYSTTFWNLFARRYSKMPVADQAAYERKLTQTRELLRREFSVLEFGCGTGTTALAHGPYVGSILAIDVSPRMIEICQEKARLAGADNINFRCASIEDLDTESTYDVIMAHSILHLLDDWQGVLDKVSSLLKPGGYFVSSTACLGSSSALPKALMRFGGMTGLIPSVQFFTRRELLAATEKRGFDIQNEWQPDEKSAVFVIARKAARD